MISKNNMIIGIDPSLTGTGCIVLNDSGKVEKQLLIKEKPRGKKTLDELERLLSIVEAIPLCGTFSLAMIEGLAYGVQRTTALTQLSGLNYLIRQRLYMSDIPFCVVAPTSLKKFATGKGNVGKDVMLLEAYKHFKVYFQDNNLCDAFLLARCGFALMHPDKNKLTKPQTEVINLLRQSL